MKQKFHIFSSKYCLGIKYKDNQKNMGHNYSLKYLYPKGLEVDHDKPPIEMETVPIQLVKICLIYDLPSRNCSCLTFDLFPLVDPDPTLETVLEVVGAAERDVGPALNADR